MSSVAMMRAERWGNGITLSCVRSLDDGRGSIFALRLASSTGSLVPDLAFELPHPGLKLLELPVLLLDDLIQALNRRQRHALGIQCRDVFVVRSASEFSVAPAATRA